MDFDALKTKQRALRDGFSTNLGLRVHRAISWLQKAEEDSADTDSQYIFLWIAFNAAYAQDTEQLRHTEAEAFSLFLNKLVELDKDGELYSLLWAEFSTSIRLLLDNKYVFPPFWDFHNGKITEQTFKSQFNSAKAAANAALANNDTGTVLGIVLRRLYTLRNQLVHGGATWQSSANRAQVNDGAAFLAKLVPTVVNLMMDNPNVLWGDPVYPVVE
jgi:hypothetical protein